MRRPDVLKKFETITLSMALALGITACGDGTVKPDVSPSPTYACGPDGWRWLGPGDNGTATLNPDQVAKLLAGGAVPDSVRHLNGDGTPANDFMRIGVGPSVMTRDEAAAIGLLISAGMSDFPEASDAFPDASLPPDYMRFDMYAACTPASQGASRSA